MDKPIYKYATLWGVLAGTGLAFLYLKTLGKEKNLDLVKTLLIGGGIGVGVGICVDVISSKTKKPITEEKLRALAQKVGGDAPLQVNNYMSIVKLAKLSDSDTQRVFNVINGQLLAESDRKWDENASLDAKKTILLGYGVTVEDFKVFQDVIVNNIADIISNAFPKINTKTN